MSDQRHEIGINGISIRNSIHLLQRTAMCMALLILATTAAVAQGVGAAPNNTISISSRTERSSEAPISDAATDSAEKKQVKAAEVANPGARSDSSDAPTSGATVVEAAAPRPQSTTDKWQFQFTPYLFLAGIKGTIGVNNLSAEVDIPFSDIIEELNFGFMSTFEARKNKITVLTDLMYMNLSGSNEKPSLFYSKVDTTLKTFILAPAIGYRAVDTKTASLDILGGIRYWHMSTDLDFSAGLRPATQVTRSKNWVDVVGGLRGDVHLSPRIFLRGLVDLGGGGSKFTYQLFGGGGFQASKHIAMVVGYRYLKADYDRDNFLYDAAMKGMLLGVAFKF